MADRIMEVVATTISAPIYFVTDVFDQGNVSSGQCRDLKIKSDGTLSGSPNYIDDVWNMTGGSLAAQDRVQTIDVTDEDGVTRTVAVRKL